MQLEDTWIKTEIQVSFLRGVWVTLPSRYQVHLHTLLAHFNIKLDQAASSINSLIGEPSTEKPIQQLAKKKGPVHRFDLALAKKTLTQTIDDCRKWQQLFDPSWYLMLRMQNPIVDQQLQVCTSNLTTTLFKARREVLWKSDFLPPASNAGQIFKKPGFDLPRNRRQIPYCSSKASRNADTGLDLVIDTFHPHYLANLPVTRAAVEDLARLLQSSAEVPTLGFLACVGVIEGSEEKGKDSNFEFAFGVPRELMQPQSLRCLLIEKAPTPLPLDDRFRLAKTLIRSVLSLHTYRWVHKNIRPETIILFENQNSDLVGPFLIGFETFRPIDSESYFMGDAVWERNLYRHPRRQGLYPEEEYKLQHDVYSLGVCLLEFGLWRSFVSYHPDPRPASILNITNILGMKEPKKKAFEIKKVILDIARSQLAGAMGNRYTEIVIACLTCLDGTENSFGYEKDLVDDDGLVVGIQFIEKVG